MIGALAALAPPGTAPLKPHVSRPAPTATPSAN